MSLAGFYFRIAGRERAGSSQIPAKRWQRMRCEYLEFLALPRGIILY